MAISAEKLKELIKRKFPEADVEIMEDLVNRLNFLYDKEKNKENAEEVLEILLEAEEILSYYDEKQFVTRRLS